MDKFTLLDSAILELINSKKYGCALYEVGENLKISLLLKKHQIKKTSITYRLEVLTKNGSIRTGKGKHSKTGNTYLMYYPIEVK